MGDKKTPHKKVRKERINIKMTENTNVRRKHQEQGR